MNLMDHPLSLRSKTFYVLVIREVLVIFFFSNLAVASHLKIAICEDILKRVKSFVQQIRLL